MGVTEGLLGDFNGGGLGLEFWRWVLVLVGACVVVGRRVEGVCGCGSGAFVEGWRILFEFSGGLSLEDCEV